ncbi:asparagine synthase (glutamine-hydrolyzing) [Actinosynnema sp. NPDC091369]
MCGLGGVAALGGSTLPRTTRPLLERMLATVEHRGPDDVNLRLDDAVSFAFTRLSLVGVDSGNQPLVGPDEQVVLIANGEVYNHQELERTLPDFRPRTRSDCEVLIGLYERDGLDFVDGVRGIFALALHDKRRNRLVLATDPFACKPMFYAFAGDTVVFGSEIKVLFDHPDVPREVDWVGGLAEQGLSNFSAMSTGEVNTWFRGVRKVAGGTVVTIDLATGRTDVHRYWQPGGPLPEADAPSAAEYVARYRELLWSSVEDSLMAEVELGLFLSGGVDSAAIAAIAAKLGQPVHTFTVATQATVLNGDVGHAREVAEFLGIPNTVAALPPGAVPSPADWKNLLWLMETPLTGPEQYYKYSLYRVAKALRPGMKATLLGSGADEFNGGYSDLLSMGGGWRRFEANIDRLAVARVVRPEFAPWLTQRAPLLLTLPALADDPRGVDSYADFLKWKWRDVQQYNCWHEDRNAAGSGVEARVPFLDRRLVDLSTSVPPSLRERLLWDKWMAREAVRDVLPESVVRREKKPFFNGRTAHFAHGLVVDALNRDGMALVEEALAGPRMAEYVDGDALRRTVAALKAGRSPLHPQVPLRVVNLGLLDVLARGEREPFRPERVTLLAKSVEADRDAVDAALGGVEVRPTSVVAFGPGARFARDEADGTWLLIKDLAVTHTVDEALAPGWVRFLRAVDGARSVAELVEVAGIGLDEVAEYLDLCVETGYLVLRPSLVGVAP